MHIDDYRFGSITVDNHTYSSDVVITPSGVKDHWWRREGHRLDVADLTDVIEAKPEYLVIGTGYYGRMEIPEATRRFLAEHDIRVKEGTTREAVEAFNELQRESARIVAALHLTC